MLKSYHCKGLLEDRPSDGQKGIALLDDKILIKKQDLSAEVVDTIKHYLSFNNPRYFKNLRFNRSNANVPRKLNCFKEDASHLHLSKGCASRLIDIFHQHRIRFKLCDNTPQFPEESFGFHGSLLDYQKRAINEMGNRRYGILVAPTGCGKKVLALYLINKRKLPTLIIVRSKYRFYQWNEILLRCLGIDDNEIGLIGDGHQVMGKKITIAIDRSLYRQIDGIKEKIGFIIVDQCETANLKIFFNAVGPIASRYILGLSKYPQRTDGLTGLMLAHVGPILHSIEAPHTAIEFIHGNQLFKIHKSLFSFRYEDNFAEMITALCNDTERNQLIVEDILFEASQAKSKVWVISERLEHLHSLQELLATGYQNSVGVINGKTTDKAREKIYDQLKKGKLKIIMTTLKGIESSQIKNVNVLIIASPFKDGFPLIKAMGALRWDSIKGTPIIYDYADQPGILRVSLKKRIKLYRRLGFREELLSPDIVQ